MKIITQTRSFNFTRSALVLGFGCALAALPLGSTLAQDATPVPPSGPGQVNTTHQDNMGTSSTAPSSGMKNDKSGEKLTGKEKRFMNSAGEGNSAEVMMAELALKNGESQGVKDFAQRMITDHKDANMQLDAIAKSHGLGKFEPMVTGPDKAMYAQMTSLKGTAFDTAYIKHAVVDHEKDLKEYNEAKKDVKDEELLAYVDKTASVVEEHLKMAKELSQTSTTTANH